MRLTAPSRSHNFGLLRIAEEVRVVELDAYREGQPTTNSAAGKSTICFSDETLGHVLSNMAVVVPSKDEELSVVRDVISAIPAPCVVILVSNCPRRPSADPYLQQVAMLEEFGGYGRQVVAIHQKDARAAAAFRAAGLPELLDPTDGTIQHGKGEGMLLGIALAAALCPERRYIGFVDADNFNAVSVNEYCRAFAAGFAMSRDPEIEHTMVRLKWASKPKLRQDGRFENVAEGRCSRIVNPWLNRVFAASRGRPSAATALGADAECPFVTTANAGEHAMTMGLALKLRIAAGYAIEPFHFVDLLERGHLLPLSEPEPQPEPEPPGKTNGRTIGNKKNDDNRSTVLPTNHSKPAPDRPPRALDRPVSVLQVRTINPHFHRASDEHHIRGMWAAGLGCIYHGLAAYRSAPDEDRDKDKDKDSGDGGGGAIAELREEMVHFADGALPCPRIYPALEDLDMAVFVRELLFKSTTGGKEGQTLSAFGLVDAAVGQEVNGDVHRE
ncbi:ab33b427-87f3-4efe-a4ee-96a1e802818e [Thermothielavioides terrestris]|jgi:mannosyl-3-phosphoglycerate synthase|uniref:Ab33b427-87f3-4efe-a4ee-96a1e802818e n=1 Tax=Thermothielavioides terrestris TaxID=2587410 RepID=A0A446BVC0_9PEZI|nr:ab33b427-87f3-4efe-a4ee-96a1e802818e [Thermothielavioides terrestris]